MNNTYNSYLIAYGRLTAYIRAVRARTLTPDWRAYRSLQVQVNSLHQQVYGR
jgi:hypothetical protein